MSRRRRPKSAPSSPGHDTGSRRPRESPARMNGRRWIYLALLLVATTAVLSPVLHAEYLNYDDDIYVTENPYIRQLDGHSVQALFTSRYENQYAPVAMLIMAAEFKLFGGSLPALRGVAIAVHLANTLLVCALVFLLFRTFQVAFIAAALFALHPMQVESVAWITAHMKIGWYAFFSLASLVIYVRYTQTLRAWLLPVSLLLFALSCLSKEQAVALVGTLPLTDYALGRDLRRGRVWWEKLTFLAIAIGIGSVTLRAAASQQGHDVFQGLGIGERLLVGAQAFASYLAKLAVPLRLSAFYTYPARIPGAYALAFVVVAGVLAALFVAWRRRQRMLVFGIGFYLIHLVLTLVNVVFALRDVMMADRYVYLAAAGAFVVLGCGWYRVWERAPRSRAMWATVLAVYVAGLGLAANVRARVWRDSLTLFSDVIEKEVAAHGRDNPHLSLAYNNRGVARKNRGDTQAALADFNEAIRINPRDPRGFDNRATYYFNRRDFDHALPDYDRAIALDPEDAVGYSNRGGLLASTGRYDRALADFDRALRLRPDFLDAIRGRALLFYTLRRYEDARKDCDHYLALSPSADVLGLRALAYQGLGRTREAEADFTNAIRLDPQGGIYYRDRSAFYRQLGDRARALQDARAAQSLGVPLDSTYLKSLE